LTELLDEVLSERTTAEWFGRLGGRVPAAPVNDIAAALDGPFAREQARIWQVPHPLRNDFRMVAAPFASAGEELPKRPAPALGEHTDEILGTCGYDAERIARLRREGIV